MATKRRPADLARWVASLSPAQRARFVSMLPNAPSVRYGRSPQWQVLARQIFATAPEVRAAAKGDASSSVGQLYGMLRELASPTNEAMYRRAFGLPADATRLDVLGKVLEAVPGLRALGATPAALEKSLSTVATMAAFEQLNLRKFARDVEQQRNEGRTWDGPEQLRTDEDRKRIADADNRRRMIHQLAAESARNAPPQARGPVNSQYPRPTTERQAVLRAAYAAHSGKPLQIAGDSPGLRDFRERAPDNALVDARFDEIRESVAAADNAAASFEASLQETPEQADTIAEQWERSGNGNE